MLGGMLEQEVELEVDHTCIYHSIISPFRRDPGVRIIVIHLTMKGLMGLHLIRKVHLEI